MYNKTFVIHLGRDFQLPFHFFSLFALFLADVNFLDHFTKLALFVLDFLGLGGGHGLDGLLKLKLELFRVLGVGKADGQYFWFGFVISKISLKKRKSIQQI